MADTITTSKPDPKLANKLGVLGSLIPPGSTGSGDSGGDNEITTAGGGSDADSTASSSTPSVLASAMATPAPPANADSVATDSENKDVLSPMTPSQTKKKMTGMQKLGLIGNLIGAAGAGIGVAGHNDAGKDAMEKSLEIQRENRLDPSRIHQAEAQAGGIEATTAATKQQTARQAAEFAKNPVMTPEEKQQYELRGKVTKTVSPSGQVIMTNEAGGAVPSVIHDAASGKDTPVTTEPAKVDPYTDLAGQLQGIQKNFEAGKLTPEQFAQQKEQAINEADSKVKATSPRWMSGQYTADQRLAGVKDTNAARLTMNQNTVRGHIQGIQMQTNMANQLLNSKLLNTYDVNDIKNNTTLAKQLLANVGKDWATNPKMRALGINSDEDALATINELRAKNDEIIKRGQSRQSKNGQPQVKYKFTATDAKGNQVGSQDGTNWQPIKGQ